MRKRAGLLHSSRQATFFLDNQLTLSQSHTAPALLRMFLLLGSFYFVRNHPMFLGLLTQYFLTKVHAAGIALGGDQGAITTSAPHIRKPARIGTPPVHVFN
jgi:hypothetical protein